MIYLTAPAGLIALIVLWVIVRALRRHKRDSLKQEGLSSAFDRSHAVRDHGDGAQGISQNILIAGLVTSAAKSGRSPIS